MIFFILENLRRRRLCEFCGVFFYYFYLMNNVIKILVEFIVLKMLFVRMRGNVEDYDVKNKFCY